LTFDVLNTALVRPFESICTDILTFDDRRDRNLGFAALPGKWRAAGPRLAAPNGALIRGTE